MTINASLILFILMWISASSQIKGVVKDEKNVPIPYASVVYPNTKYGVNTNEDGTFELPKIDSLKFIQVSNLGFETKIISVQNEMSIVLSPEIYELNEVIIEKPTFKNQIALGKLEFKNFSYANYGTNTMWGKFFEFNSSNDKFKFVKEINFYTKSNIKNAKIKLRIFTLNKENKIQNDLIEKDLIIVCDKGKQKHTIDLSSQYITFQKEGIMVALENLIIDENKYSYTYILETTGVKHKEIRYEPSLVGFYNSAENNVWSVKNDKAVLVKFDQVANDISIQLVLTN